MCGQWLRVTDAELDRARVDLPWAHDLARRVEETEYAPGQHLEPLDVAERRSFGTDKTWHALAFLLARREFPVSIIYGEESFVDDPDDPTADWGYGAPNYLTPDQVRRAAGALAELSEDDLLDGVDADDLQRATIYPNLWDRGPEELRWAVGDLPWIKVYFQAAANDGDAIICWIA
jgi:Domain of unknown function (DUF1877)